MSLPIVVQLLHSVQVLPDSSDKIGPVSITFQTKQRPNRLSFSERKKASKLNCVTGVHLQNHGELSLYKVILQSTFSRNFTSFGKQKRVNAHGQNSVTRYSDDEMSGAFYSCGLTYPALDFEIMRENVPFSRASHILMKHMYKLQIEQKHLVFLYINY